MVKMEQEDANIRSQPLSFLPKSTKSMLSYLLNPPKVLPAEGSQKLARDWRGLADLAGITSEVQANIRHSLDQTGKVLDLWMRKSSVSVGTLLDHLEKMDRFDVYDDVREDLLQFVSRKDKGIVNIPDDQLLITEDEESEIITYDDRPGYNHRYDAYVLYAKEDQEFVIQLTDYLGSQGYQICTKDKLLPGQITYPRLAKLISERCLRIILVYSPEFLDSFEDTFFRDYAQAISIESRRNKIIPLMYRDCYLPSHLALYHNLRYDSPMYDFWEKLALTLRIPRMRRMLAGSSPMAPRIELSAAHSAVDIVEVSTAEQGFLQVEGDQMTQRSASVETFDASSTEGSFDGSYREHSDVQKKKASKVKSFLNKLTRKKRDKRVMEEVGGS